MSGEINITDEQIRELELRHQMRVNWQERIHMLYHNPGMERQPWPMWSEVPTEPSNPLDRERWENYNVMRIYWSTRLNEGYSMTNIYIRDTPFDSLPGLPNPESYKGGQELSNKHTSNSEKVKDLDIFEEDSLYLDLFFAEDSDTSEKRYYIFEDDSLCLDLLFGED